MLRPKFIFTHDEVRIIVMALVEFISSPELLREKVNRFLFIIRPRQEAGVKVTVITTDPDSAMDSSADYYMDLVSSMTDAGVNVITRSEVLEHFAVIDDDIVWHGGVNLLGLDDIWDNLMRIKSPVVAAELMEISLGDDKWETWDYEAVERFTQI